MIGVGVAIANDVDGLNLGDAPSGGGAPDLVVASVTLTPASQEGFTGEVLEFFARALNAAGEGIPGKTFTAESDDTDVATVSVSGHRVLVSLAAVGMTTVTAAVGAVESDPVDVESIGRPGTLVSLGGGAWAVSDEPEAVADGYIVTHDAGETFVPDPDAESGLPLTVAVGRAYVRYLGDDIALAIPADLTAPTTQTAIVDLGPGPGTFLLNHVFDVGKPRTAHLKMTILSIDGDGETLGAGPGTISVDFQPFSSQDGVEYVHYSASLFHGSPPPFEVGGIVDYVQFVARFVKFEVIIYSPDAAPPGIAYDGANGPTTQVRLEITY